MLYKVENYYIAGKFVGILNLAVWWFSGNLPILIPRQYFQPFIRNSVHTLQSVDMALLKYLQRGGPVFKCGTLSKEGDRTSERAHAGELLMRKRRLARSAATWGTYTDCTPEDRARQGDTGEKSSRAANSILGTWSTMALARATSMLCIATVSSLTRGNSSPTHVRYVRIVYIS